MSKLYIGNLPPDTYESQLKQVFHDLNLSFTDVMLKRGGYGFVDCADQSSADHFIDKLNGYNYRGVSLVVEPSVSSLGSQHNRHMQQQQQQQHSLSINDHSVSPALNNHHHPPLNHHHHNSNNGNHHHQQQQQQQTHHISAHHYNTHQPHYNSHHHLPPPTAAAVPSLAHHSHHQTAPYSSSVDRCGVGVSGAVAGTRAASMTALPHATAAASLHQHPNSVHMQPPPLPSAVHRSDAGASAVNAGMMSSHHPHHHHHLNHHQANHHHHHHLNSHHHQTAGGGHSGGGVVECPLRLLVTSDMVGAIIGRQGNTIRQITQSTRARVDVHRNDGGANGSDKAITIYGQPDNCDNACRRILEVMLQEASSTNKGDVPLRLLAHNNLIGRIIGKGGSVIKRIMDETDAKVTVSSVSDVCSYNMERTITICGELDNVTDAEKLIAAKLRQSYHNDLQTMAPQSMMYSSLHHSLVPSSAAAAAVAAGYPSAGAGGRSAGSLAGGSGLYGSCPSSHTAANTAAGGMCGPLYPSMMAMGAPSSQQQQRQCAVAAAAAAACAGVRRGMAAGGGVPLVEVAYLYVPSASVGALIGRRGSHVRSIIRFSGASVKIGQQPETPAAVAAESAGGGGGGGGEEAAMTRRQQQPPLLSVVPATVTGRRPFLRTALEGGGQRKVTITGSAEAQWKAQFLIFDKLREEGYGGCVEEVRVPLEVPVPGSQVGRIIGKKGANVRQLQRSTGALIKLPQLSTSGGGGGGGDPANADASSVKVVCVQLLGVFYAVQAAQRRIRQLVASAPPPPPLAPQQHAAVAVVNLTDAASTNAATAVSAGDLVDEELTDASGDAAAQQQPAAAATQIDVAASLPDGSGGSEVVSSGDASTRDSPASVTVATLNDHDIMTSPT